MRTILKNVRPGDVCKVQIGSVKRAMTVLSRTVAYDHETYIESMKLTARRGKLRVEISARR